MAAYERVQAQPEVRAARDFAAVEQKAQQRRVTIVETWQQEVVQQKSVPAVREVEDDWFILLDVAAKKSGRVWLTQSNSAPSVHLHCTRSVLFSPPKITPYCVFLVVALPKYPTEARAPTAVARTRTAVSETRPQFAKRILEERPPLTRTHVNDDWFVLLDVDTKESGIFF